MTKFNKFLSVLVLSFTTLVAGTNPSSALTSSLSWTGNGLIEPSQTYSLTGSFTGNDNNNDGFIRSSNNEITGFDISFFKNPSTSLFTYNFSEITNDPSFSFNYQINNNTVLQTGTTQTPLLSLSIGNSVNGYSLDSFTGSGLSFNDFAFGLDDATGGTLTAAIATPIPFEFSPIGGLLVLGAWGVRKRLKNIASL
jgi:hypothetical protein